MVEVKWIYEEFVEWILYVGLVYSDVVDWDILLVVCNVIVFEYGKGYYVL